LGLATKEEARRLGYRTSRAPRTPPPAPRARAGRCSSPCHTPVGPSVSPDTTGSGAARRSRHKRSSAAWKRSGPHSQPAAASDPAKQRDADPRPTRPGQDAAVPPGGPDRPASEVGPGTLHHSTHRGDSVRVLATRIRERPGHAPPLDPTQRRAGRRAKPDALTSAWTRSHGRGERARR
jgi:hypothetical protein